MIDGVNAPSHCKICAHPCNLSNKMSFHRIIKLAHVSTVISSAKGAHHVHDKRARFVVLFPIAASVDRSRTFRFSHCKRSVLVKSQLGEAAVSVLHLLELVDPACRTLDDNKRGGTSSPSLINFTIGTVP